MGSRIAQHKFQVVSLKWLYYKGLRAIPLAIALVGAIELIPLSPEATMMAIAQEEDQFPPNPLEIDESDPLFPQLIIDRPPQPSRAASFSNRSR
ncbi:MAG: hypothetical protein HC899_24465 [Leptolyngbyaceae cyanobacterium SM1_4_3]|nr:hypothetical protein [Leptolyngbyaceae cyanobacterium SM1_4_3]